MEVATERRSHIETAEAGEGGVHVHRYSVYQPHRDAESHGAGSVHQSDAVRCDRTRRVRWDARRICERRRGDDGQMRRLHRPAGHVLLSESDARDADDAAAEPDRERKRVAVERFVREDHELAALQQDLERYFVEADPLHSAGGHQCR